MWVRRNASTITVVDQSYEHDTEDSGELLMSKSDVRQRSDLTSVNFFESRPFIFSQVSSHLVESVSHTSKQTVPLKAILYRSLKWSLKC